MVQGPPSWARLRTGRGASRMDVLLVEAIPFVNGRKHIDRPPPLNVIRLGNEWIVTNGELAADGSIRFPEEDPAEEVFGGNGIPPDVIPPGKPSAPPSES